MVLTSQNNMHKIIGKVEFCKDTHVEGLCLGIKADVTIDVKIQRSRGVATTAKGLWNLVLDLASQFSYFLTIGSLFF